MLRSVVVTGLALLGVAAGGVPADATTPGGQPVIAVLDSGINEHHHAFDSGQVVAWWDFVKDGAPKAGQSWDPKRAPYDDLGHGTGTAAMAAGRQVDTRQSPSAAPGTRLAIGKVLDENDSMTGDLAAAVRWAVDTAHADVISISIGFIEP